MTLDTTLSLDVVIAVLVVFGAVWSLNSKIDSKVDGLRKELIDTRKELKDDVKELKDDIGSARKELKDDIGSVRAKVDNVAERLARVEGKLDVREVQIEPAQEAEPAA